MRLLPRTYADVRYRADANLTREDFARAVQRAGYVPTSITIRGPN